MLGREFAPDTLADWVAATADPSRPFLMVGDFNVAPTDLDVYDPQLWRGKNLASEPERDRIKRLLTPGLVDLGRAAAGDVEGQQRLHPRIGTRGRTPDLR